MLKKKMHFQKSVPRGLPEYMGKSFLTQSKAQNFTFPDSLVVLLLFFLVILCFAFVLSLWADKFFLLRPVVIGNVSLWFTHLKLCQMCDGDLFMLGDRGQACFESFLICFLSAYEPNLLRMPCPTGKGNSFLISTWWILCL